MSHDRESEVVRDMPPDTIPHAPGIYRGTLRFDMSFEGGSIENPGITGTGLDFENVPDSDYWTASPTDGNNAIQIFQNPAGEYVIQGVYDPSPI